MRGSELDDLSGMGVGVEVMTMDEGAIGELNPNLASGPQFDTIFWGWVCAGPRAKDREGSHGWTEYS